MERSFQAAMLLHDPEVVFVLGEYNNVNDSFDFGCVTQLLLCFVLCLYFYCSVCVQLNVTVRWSCVLPVSKLVLYDVDWLDSSEVEQM